MDRILLLILFILTFAIGMFAQDMIIKHESFFVEGDKINYQCQEVE